MAGKRRSIHVEGIQHGAPIPMGALVGNILFSSGISGTDPATGSIPDDIDRQCELAFANMKSLVENAGGTVDDIGSVKVHMKDRGQREALNRPWVKTFPDAESRPARHVVENPGLAGVMQIQLEITAILMLILVRFG